MRLVVVFSLPFLIVFAFFPVLRRLALRNAVRRPREAALVLLGSMLGTAILTGSFVVGDTMEASLQRNARDQLGPIDEVVVVPAGQAQAARQRISALNSPDIDGVLPMTLMTVSAATRQEPRRAAPRSQLVEVDFTAARAFGGDPAATGIEGQPPAANQAVITADVAGILAISEGDPLDVFAFGQKLELSVERVLPRTGIAGFGIGFQSQSHNVFVAPGTIAGLAPADAPDTGAGGLFSFGGFGGRAGGGSPQHIVAVSNTGGVYDGAGRTDAVVTQIEQAVEGTGATVQGVKQQVLDQAEQAGSAFSGIFTTMGSFGVIAGILLLVNIFVMLAEERRSELGMLRAVGMRRSSLVMAFSAEGWLYAIVSATLGALVGVGLGNVVANLATGIFSGPAGGADLKPVFAASAQSVQRGFSLGFFLAVVTVFVTSVRLSRFNVIHAIRDLDEAPASRRGIRSLVAGASAVVLGGLWLLAALPRSQAVGLLLAPLLMLVGVASLLTRVVQRRAVISTASLAAIAWGIVGLRFFRTAAGNANVVLFVAQGVILTASAIVLVSQNQDIIGATLRRLGGGSRAMGLRLGLAYPLARRFRTGMTLAMYTLVMFMLTFITVFSHMVFNQVDRFAQNAVGGFDVIVTSNPTNPIDPAEVAQRPGVEGVAPLGTTFAEVVLPRREDPQPVLLSSFDERWVALGPPTLEERGSYPTDADAYRAVLQDPDLIIVNPSFLAFGRGGFGGGRSQNADSEENGGGRGGGGFGPPREQVGIGDTIQLLDPSTANSRDVRVAALAGGGFGGQGALYGAANAQTLFGDRTIASSLYVATMPGVDPEQFAAELSGAYVEHGAEATALASQIAAFQSAFLGLFGVIRGYLGLGLLVGIAGLGVVMVRAVRERRRQIGVLRALGFESSTIRRAFVIEAGFVALEGALIGVALALVTVYSIVALSGSSASVNGSDTPFTFSVPIAAIATLVVGTLAASLLATAAPSQAASRIRPAVALRIAD